MKLSHMNKLLVIGSLGLLLSGCGGYDEEACYQSAVDHMNDRGGDAHLIPGEKWTYIGISDEAVFFMEAMNQSNCDLTKVYQINQ